MSLRPELNIRETVGKFPPDLVGGVLWSLATDGHRSMVADAKRFYEKNHLTVTGRENLKSITCGPAFLVFNHPVTSNLVEGVLTIVYAISDKSGAGRDDFALVAAGEIPLGQGGYLKQSVDFMEKLSDMYWPHLLLVPNNKTRPEYQEGRHKSVSTIGHLLTLGHIVALAAEGDWGKKTNETLPDSSIRYGAGQIAIDTYRLYDGVVLPVGIAVDTKGHTQVNFGPPMVPETFDKKIVALQIAGEIKKLLPANMVVR